MKVVKVEMVCVVLGWYILLDGCKYEVGIVVFDEYGELVGVGKVIWIEFKM